MTAKNTSEDVWLLIFRSYLEEPSTIPISLTSVCRQWYNLIHATPSLWFRVVINVITGKSIPLILSSVGFRKYLAHTDGNGTEPKFPLDIEVRCRVPSAEEHNFICKKKVYYGRRWCFRSDCGFIRERREQLDALFATLADAKVAKTEPHNHTSIHNIGSKSMRGSRIDRWQSLIFESDGSFEDYTGSYESWMKNPAHCAPRLLYLTIRGIPPWYAPHEGFAPNLIDLTLENIPTYWKYEAINVPSLKSLSLQQPTRHIVWFKLSGICYAEELCIAEGGSGLIPATISVKFPNLKRLKMYTTVTYRLLSSISDDFEQSARRLEQVHLVNGDLWKSGDYFRRVPILTKARKIILETRPADPGEPVHHRPPLAYVKKFLALCAPDTEIVAVDENSAKVLSIVHEEIKSAGMINND